MSECQLVNCTTMQYNSGLSSDPKGIACRTYQLLHGMQNHKMKKKTENGKETQKVEKGKRKSYGVFSPFSVHPSMHISEHNDFSFAPHPHIIIFVDG